VGLNLLLNLIFMVPLAHIGPALATSLAAICNVGGLAFVLLQRGHFLPDHQLQKRCRGMIGASIIMAAALWGLRVLMFESPPHGWLRMAFLGGLVGGGVLAYATAASLLGACDRREIRRMMSRRRLRGDGGSAINSSPTTET
jgi:putative peptidoglycan lipid II flippase